jgi:hypothetical protein
VVVSKENAATEFDPVRGTYKKLVPGDVAANPGDGRVEPGKGTGCPTALSTPVVELIVKTETLEAFTANRNLPEESVTASTEFGETENGEPEMAVSDPLFAIEKPVIVPFNPNT